MVKTLKICLILLFLSPSVRTQPKDNQEKINPTVKSFLIPGWGQHSLLKPRRGNKFIILESTLIISYLASLEISNRKKKNYIAYALQHANVSKAGKDHNYWVDIGNYNNLYDYNAEHLRNRDMDALYIKNSTWDWNWDLSARRTNFEKQRISSDQWRRTATFIMGGIVLNHIISLIDAVYLSRLQAAETEKNAINWELNQKGFTLCLYF